MLTLNPARILKLRNIAKPFAYLKNNGFTHHTTYLLLQGKLTSIKLAHIQKLCHLLKCSPHDLLAYTPDATAPEPATDTLAPFIRPASETTDLSSIFQELPIDRLESISQELLGRLAAPPPTV